MRGRLPNVVNCVCGGKARIDFGEVGFYVRCERDPGLTSATEYATPKRAANAWNKAQNEMDQLAVNAVCAYHSRKSYGQYIAGVQTQVQSRKSTVVTQELRCIHCGMLIPPAGKSKRYCSPECADLHRRDQRRIREQIKKGNEEQLIDDRPKCLECGKPIPGGSKRFRYCCGVCADKAMERMKAEYAKRRKLRGGAR